MLKTGKLVSSKQMIQFNYLRKNRFNFLIVTLILIFIFIKVYSIHFNYSYPMHLDEYHHIAQSVQIIEKKGFVSTNPYFAELIRHENLEPGFHILLSEMFLLTGIDPVKHYGFLPAFFACLSAFMLFVFVNRITGNFWTGIFAMLFFASLKSSVNILGINFLTPLTACIPLVYLFLLMFIEALSDIDLRKLLISIILSAILVLIYPLCGTLIMPVAFLYLLFNPKTIKGFYLKIINSFAMEKLKANRLFYVKTTALIIGIGMFIIIVSLYFWNYIPLLSNKTNIMNLLIFREGWGRVEIKYFIPYLYGITATVLASIGMIVSFKKKKYKMIAFFVLIMLVLIGMFNKYKFTVLSPYQRTLYFTMLALVPLSAIGLTFILGYLNKLIKIYLQKNVARKIIITVFVVIIFIGVFSEHYGLIDEKKIYRRTIINEEDYKTIKWLERNYGQHNTVLAPVFISATIYPISKNYVVSILSGQLGGGNLNASVSFFKAVCNEKKSIIEENEVNLVFSRERINCSWLKEVYSNKNFVYEVLN